MAAQGESTSQTTASRLRQNKRYITTNDAAGRSIFFTGHSDEPPRQAADGYEVSFCFGVDQTPPDFHQEADIARYENLIANPPGMVIPNGCVARLVDMPPSYTSPMHRTISLNYNFVIEGVAELILDSGEVRELHPGDMVVQRAVNHAWRTMGTTKWLRITAFAVPAIAPGEVNVDES